MLLRYNLVCEQCDGDGWVYTEDEEETDTVTIACQNCAGTGIKPTTEEALDALKRWCAWNGYRNPSE